MTVHPKTEEEDCAPVMNVSAISPFTETNTNGLIILSFGPLHFSPDEGETESFKRINGDCISP